MTPSLLIGFCLTVGLAMPVQGTMYAHDTVGLTDGVRVALTRAAAPEDLATPEAVYRLPATAFTPVEATAVALPASPAVAWLRLDLPPAVMNGSRVWLQIHAPHRAQLDVYNPHGDTWYHTEQNAPARLVPGTLGGATRLITLRPQGARPVLLRVAVPAAATLSLQVWHPEPWVAQQMRKDFAWGMYFGLLLASLLIAALAAALLRALEIYAIAALLAAAIAVALTHGFASWLWLTDYPALAATLAELSVVGFFLTAAWVVHAGLYRAGDAPVARAGPGALLLRLAAVVTPLLVLLDYPHAGLRAAFVLWLALSLAALGQGWRRGRAAGASAPYLTLLLVWQLFGGIALFAVVGGHFLAPGGFTAVWQASLVVFATVLGVMTLRRVRHDHLRRMRDNTALLLSSQQAQALLEAQVQARTAALNQALHHLRAALARERAAQARRGEFLRCVAHDLRTPLAVVTTTVETLMATAPATTPAAVREDYQRLARAGQRLVTTVDQHLAPDSGALAATAEVILRPCALPALIAEVVAAAGALTTGHRFEVQLADVPPQVPCDPEMLRVAMRNLVDNAVKYTPAGTTIRVYGGRTGRRQGDAVWLAVSDDGPGLSAADRDQLFTPGFRAATSADQAGQGLGLPLARRMIEAQGGVLSVTPSPGTGLTFTLWLPGATPAAPDNAPPQQSPAGCALDPVPVAA